MRGGSGSYPCVSVDHYVSPDAVGQTDLRTVWVQTACPTLPSVGGIVNKKNQVTPPQPTRVMLHTSSAHFPAYTWRWSHWGGGIGSTPPRWFTSDPHWWTSFCASCQGEGNRIERGRCARETFIPLPQNKHARTHTRTHPQSSVDGEGTVQRNLWSLLFLLAFLSSPAA